MGDRWTQEPALEHPVAVARPPARSRRWWWAAAAPPVVVTLAVAGPAGGLDHVPLLDHPVALGVEAAGGALLIAAWWRRDRRWITRTLPVLLVVVAALVGLIAITLWTTGTISDTYPPSFAVWVGAGIAAIAGCPLALRHAGAWRNAAAVLAVPLTFSGAFLLIDQHYGIWPQFGDVLGHSGAVGGRQAHDLLDAATAPDGAPPRHGIILGLDVPGTHSHFRHRPGVVFLPPAYFSADRQRLPVLVMLVGSPGTPINWLKSGHAQATDDAYAAAHHGIAPVLVAVDHNGSTTGDSECVDGPQGNAETYLTVDVPAFVTDTLRLRPDPSRWGIVGFSEGGTCALDLVLGHPDVYRHFLDLGGDARPNLGSPAHTLSDLFGGSVAAQQAHDPVRLLRTGHYPGVTAWFGAGAGDPRDIAVSRRLAAATAEAGIPTHLLIVGGGHNWQFASAALARTLPPLCDELGCAAGPAPAAAGQGK
ncbi:hypothetical protein Drose_12325 [Dactylosporangium roseum]|uniref:Esterase n=1 Tax=Dactylosporangium roseum TaxID=47989 RepID=A0ABY5ZA70_9ACTN|nr:alpha/beta hydrolase-fold protein [Dactylosporangium roseum]UWZ38936.1 hypothetical protein Drose_12325 [Dactylosporangium roseum]